MVMRQEYDEDLDIDEPGSWLTSELPPVIPEFVQKVTSLLFHPDTFFKNMYEHHVTMKIPFIIILLLSLVNIYYLNYFEIDIFKYAGDNVIYQSILVIQMVVSFISGFYRWILISLFFTILLYFYIHSFFSPFIRTLPWVAYGMIPNFFLIIVDRIFEFIFSPIKNAIYIEILSEGDFSTYGNGWDLYINPFKMNPVIFGLNLVEFIIGILFLLWSAKIWYYGLGYAESLPENQTRTVVQIVVGFFIVVKILFWIL